MTKIAVCLLAYNEEEVIAEVIDEGYDYLSSLNIDYELWIFDNNSNDKTKSIVQKLQRDKEKLNYYKQKSNVGYGLNTISALKIPNADIIFVIDGDGQYSFNDIPKFIKLIHEGNDIMYGFRKERKDILLRKITTVIYNLFARMFIKSYLTDINCGFRALSSESAKKIVSKFKLNYIGAEIFAQSKKYNLKVGEATVEHKNRRSGDSVFNNFSLVVKHSIIMIKQLAELRKNYF